MKVVACPLCGSEINLSYDQWTLAYECNQIMCWEVCGMDITLPPMWMIFHAWDHPDFHE